MTTYTLTPRERENARTQAIRAMRARLDATRPDERQYASGDGRAAALITGVLSWAKAFVPVIAALAALASSVRTIQTAAEIYVASGSHVVGVVIAAIAFTLSAEGALFALALAQEGQRLKWRAEKRARRVGSLRGLWHGILVRVGVRDALAWHELPENTGGLAVVLGIAFAFAVASNAYMGLRPLLAAVGEGTLQQFISDLTSASATIQMSFIVDLAAVLFPPLMAWQAGHLTAHFAAEVAAGRAAIRAAYEADLARWRAAYTDPLATDEGAALLAEYEREKVAAKQARTATAADARPTQAAQAAPLPELQPVQTMRPTPTATAIPSGNGNGNGSHG